MRSAIILAAVTGVFAMPALAADPIGLAPAIPSVITPTSVAHDWTGFYVGASAGYGWASTNAPVDDQSGWGASLHAGYNYDFGDWVAGVRGDFVPSGFSDLSSGDRELGHSGRVVGTAGYKFGETGNTLAYAAGGVAIVQSTEGGTDYTDYGWTVGLGVAHALDDNLSVSGEVTYARFEDVGGTSYDVDGVGISVGLSYSF